MNHPGGVGIARAEIIKGEMIAQGDHFVHEAGKAARMGGGGRLRDLKADQIQRDVMIVNEPVNPDARILKKFRGGEIDVQARDNSPEILFVADIKFADLVYHQLVDLENHAGFFRHGDEFRRRNAPQGGVVQAKERLHAGKAFSRRVVDRLKIQGKAAAGLQGFPYGVFYKQAPLYLEHKIGADPLFHAPGLGADLGIGDVNQIDHILRGLEEIPLAEIADGDREGHALVLNMPGFLKAFFYRVYGEAEVFSR